jgi:hypothetical protein
MSPRPLPPSGTRDGALTALAAPAVASDEEWQLLDTEALPRQAFDLVVAFGAAQGEGDVLAELVAIRNALTRDGKLLAVFRGHEAWSDLQRLVAQAGFTRIRRLDRQAPGSSTLVLQR